LLVAAVRMRMPIGAGIWENGAKRAFKTLWLCFHANCSLAMFL